MTEKITFNPDGVGTGEVCIANISPKERQFRKRFGVGLFIFTLVVLATLVLLHVDPFWRLLLFFMFSAAITSYIQALDKT
jgi:hypothetical protein